MKIFTFILLLFLTSQTYAARKSENIFYLTPDVNDAFFSDALLNDISTHAKSINVLAPQVYAINSHGEIKGKLDPKLITIANHYSISLLPLVTNIDFDQAQFHAFLLDSNARQNAIQSLIDLCKQNHFSGIQFDLENINFTDKDALTQFYTAAANALHQNGFIASITLVPRTSDSYVTDYDRWYFTNWSGAYDFSKLAAASDFVSLMSYDNHTSLTTPGPIAAYHWVEITLLFALQTIPAEKISLGIPDYSGYWTTGKMGANVIPEKYTFRAKESQLGYTKLQKLLATFKPSLGWQPQWKIHYAIFDNEGRNDYLFVEDAKSFTAKYKLVSKYHLRGISVWKLGLEEPGIWKTL